MPAPSSSCTKAVLADVCLCENNPPPYFTVLCEVSTVGCAFNPLSVLICCDDSHRISLTFGFSKQMFVCYLQKASLYLPQKQEGFSKQIIHYSNSVGKWVLHRNILFRCLRVEIYYLEEVLEYKS